MRRFSSVRPGLLLLALAIAVFLWGMASGTSDAERGFDIPVVLDRLPDSLVVTDQSSDAVNVRVMGSGPVLRSIAPEKYKYVIDVSGGKPGVAVYDVELARVNLPRGANFVAHSPSRVQVRFEKRGRKAVAVVPDLEGEPAAGFHVAGIEVEPGKVWLAGARSQVMRLDSVGTETINISGLNAPVTKEVRLSLGRGTVWAESDSPVQVQLMIEPDVAPEPIESNLPEQATDAQAAAF